MSEYTGNIEASLPDIYILVGSETDPTLVAKAADQAASTIEVISGVVFDGEYREISISSTDAVWLRKATVFQAAWLVEQAGVFSRQGVSSLSQDGISLSAMDGLTFVLAPLAKRALNNCSWTRNGTYKVSPVSNSNVESVMISDNHPWLPLGSA